MGNRNTPFVAVGFLYNPVTKCVLLQHRDSKAPTHPNKWGFFGGSGEGKETILETFVRELKEELNIDLKINDIRPLYDYFDQENKRQRYIFYVESEMDKSEMTLSEGQGFDWIHLEKVFECDLHEKARRDIEEFIKVKIAHQ